MLVTSALPNEGKTTTSANLAAVFAESGASVLAVNCDFRRPTLHRYLGAEQEPRRVQESNIPGVALVSGVVSDPAANPAQVIAAQRQVVATARDRFDVIILDTAPLLTTNDAIEIIPVVDLVVLVARPGVTTADAAERTRTLLGRVDAPVAGAVFVGDETVPNDPYYYYSQASGAAAASAAGVPDRQPPPEIAEDLEVVDQTAPEEADAVEEPDVAETADEADETENDESFVASASEPAIGPRESGVGTADQDEPTEEIAAVATADNEPDAERELESKPRRKKRRFRRSN